MRGNINIFDSIGHFHEIKDVSHDKYMEYRRAINDNQDIFYTTNDGHMSINARHVVSIEWEHSKQ